MGERSFEDQLAELCSAELLKLPHSKDWKTDLADMLIDLSWAIGRTIAVVTKGTPDLGQTLLDLVRAEVAEEAVRAGQTLAQMVEGSVLKSEP